jgi:hypothetical protein
MILARRLATAIAASYLGVSAAAANDLPVKGNLAAEEVLEIERGIYAAPQGSKARAKLFSVFSRKLTWQTGILKVCFWNGNADRQSAVATIADELVAGLPVKFQWHENGALVKCSGGLEGSAPWRSYQVRVSLNPAPGLLKPGDNPSAFFSLIGRQNRADRRATVNLPFSADDGTEEVRHRTLHEFCHVLGCLHEHQRELCARDFDENKIRAKFSLTADEYRNNFLTIPSGHAYGPVTASAFDSKSVMLYRLTPDMFAEGSASPCIVSSPAQLLSPLDIQGLQGAYQFAAIGLQLRLEDFPRLEKEARSTAAAQRLLANRLRSTSLQWQSRVKNIIFDKSGEIAAIEALAEAADERARVADAEAASYALTPGELAAARKALSYFPDD